jgi:hypothetical protein
MEDLTTPLGRAQVPLADGRPVGAGARIERIVGGGDDPAAPVGHRVFDVGLLRQLPRQLGRRDAVGEDHLRRVRDRKRRRFSVRPSRAPSASARAAGRSGAPSALKASVDASDLNLTITRAVSGGANRFHGLRKSVGQWRQKYDQSERRKVARQIAIKGPIGFPSEAIRQSAGRRMVTPVAASARIIGAPRQGRSSSPAACAFARAGRVLSHGRIRERRVIGDDHSCGSSPPPGKRLAIVTQHAAAAAGAYRISASKKVSDQDVECRLGRRPRTKSEFHAFEARRAGAGR